jgi:hypothetical protein
MSKPRLNANLQRAVAINAALAIQTDPAFTGQLPRHDQIVAANDSLFGQAFLSTPLTQFATDWVDNTNLQAEVDFFAPPVEVDRRFSYWKAGTVEEFYGETIDDERPIRGNFKDVEYTQAEVLGKTVNRGLMITVDLDEVSAKTNWREKFTQKLIRRLLRNKLRRAVGALGAAASNTASTWDTTAGKDPDYDISQALITANNASGIKPNRIAYGDTAWAKRALAHRAQSTAGGFASATLTPEQLAPNLGVDRVLWSKARYASSASAIGEIVSNLVLMFNAEDNMDTSDSSNIKAFWSPCEGGERIRVYEQQVTAKLYTITVEHYELIKITSTLGIRKQTIS